MRNGYLPLVVAPQSICRLHLAKLRRIILPMPTISQFFGIVIPMFWREHAYRGLRRFTPNTRP